ncbi:MAG: hypothetical protein DMD68_10225, partial [Gemmatimonadetes bacterium]
WKRVGNAAGLGRASWGVATFLQLGRRGEINPSVLERALAAASEALAVHRTGTNRFDLAWSLHLTGMIHLKMGQFAKATADFREAASIFAADDDLTGLGIIASDSAELAGAQGQREKQAALIGLAYAISRRAGTGLLGDISREDARTKPEDLAPELRPAFDRGGAMDLTAGIAYALSES